MPRGLLMTYPKVAEDKTHKTTNFDSSLRLLTRNLLVSASSHLGTRGLRSQARRPACQSARPVESALNRGATRLILSQSSAVKRGLRSLPPHQGNASVRAVRLRPGLQVGRAPHAGALKAGRHSAFVLAAGCMAIRSAESVNPGVLQCRVPMGRHDD
jgi:hypothetical protein